MMTVKENDTFPITVGLVDEETGGMASGQVVFYDIRSFPSDTSLVPSVSGTLIESSIEPGIYNGAASIADAGNYIIYASCQGFTTSTENVIVEEVDSSNHDLSELIKQNRHYNISVEDVIRTTQTPTASQSIRKVPKGRTDYIITKIKRDEDLDWSGPNVVTGVVYAHYRRDTDQAPSKVGAEY